MYLDIRWADEHQRERARILLKNGVRDAGGADADDLRWVAEQARPSSGRR